MSRSHATPSPEAGRGTLRPHLVQTSAHTWVCVGEDVSNMGMIRGKDGIVIIDTGMHPECAARTLAAFRSVAPADDYPVRAVIYTHGHGDHTGGSPIFCTEGPRPEIWARANFGEEASFFGHAGLTPCSETGTPAGKASVCPRTNAWEAVSPPWTILPQEAPCTTA